MLKTPTKQIAIFGATGSIGASTLDLVRMHPAKFSVETLTANSSALKLAKLAREFMPARVVIADEKYYLELKNALDGTNIEVLAGDQALIDVASIHVDLFVAAIVGAAGLRPTLAAVRGGMTIALANKECLVCAGDLMMHEVSIYGATLLPVDSEHNAIFQVFDFEQPERVSKIILTASGGPFREKAVSELVNVTPAEAIAHPNWDMGAKISVDSATMMNKGLEMIEAYHLFPVRTDQIEVLIHPQSVIHSMVDYVDGSVLAQMGAPDMKIPISYCMDYPSRIETHAKKLDLASIGSLTFENPDLDRFPCLALAQDALKQGGAAPAVLNAANEIAVAAFLAENIGFNDISSVVSQTLSRLDMKAPQSIANLLDIDSESRNVALGICHNLHNSN